MESEKNEHSELGWFHIVQYIDMGDCGCGYADQRIDLLKETLNALPLHTGPVPEYLRTPLGEWFLTILDRAKLIEHGSSIGGSWITNKGERVLKILNDPDSYSVILDGNYGMCECLECEKNLS